MLSDIVNWNTTAMVIVAVLGIHTGIKLINRVFDKTVKKKNSLF